MAESLDMGRQEMTRSAALYHFPAGVLCDPLCTLHVPVPFPVFTFFCCGHAAQFESRRGI